MQCNLKRMLEAIVMGANTLAMVKHFAPGVPKPENKITTLIRSGHIQVDEDGLIQPTDKGKKASGGKLAE